MNSRIPRASIWKVLLGFGTTDPDEMAEAQAWLASLVPQSPVEPRDGANSTQTPDDANRTTEEPTK